MAGTEVPNKEKGVVATVEAHVLGQTINSIGGYFKSLTIGAGGTVPPSLNSRLEGARIQLPAFFTRLWIANDTIMWVDLLVDATDNKSKNGAGILSSLIGKKQPLITFSGQVGARRTNAPEGGLFVLQDKTITGQIWRTKDGYLRLEDGGSEDFGDTHHMQRFRLAVMSEQEDELQVNFGGDANGIWEIGPTTG
jgi:hypothetical protein